MVTLATDVLASALANPAGAISTAFAESAVARVAEEYAAELTNVFEEKRASHKEKRIAFAKKETP